MDTEPKVAILSTWQVALSTAGLWVTIKAGFPLWLGVLLGSGFVVAAFLWTVIGYYVVTKA